MGEAETQLDQLAAPPPIAAELFGDRLSLAVHYVALLARHGVQRGLIGPREVDRLWDRHVLNSAVIAELIPRDAAVVDVGSGAGLPGLPLAIARPDLRITLLEPMERRVAWLSEVVGDLGLTAAIVRGRAEQGDVRRLLGTVDVVTARAVAPLAKLAGWCLPLVRPGGRLLAMKGANAAEELARDGAAVRAADGGSGAIVLCGESMLDIATTVIVIPKDHAARDRDGGRRTRKDR